MRADDVIDRLLSSTSVPSRATAGVVLAVLLLVLRWRAIIVLALAAFLATSTTFADLVKTFLDDSPSSAEKPPLSSSQLTSEPVVNKSQPSPSHPYADPPPSALDKLAVPEQLQEPLDTLLSLVIRDFVEWWYIPISLVPHDPAFPREARRSLNYFASNICKRIDESKNGVDVAVFLFCSTSQTLLRALRSHRSPSSPTLASHLPEPTFPTSSPFHPLLRSTAAHLLALSSAPRDADNTMLQALLTELLAVQVESTVKVFTPDWVNRTVVGWFEGEKGKEERVREEAVKMREKVEEVVGKQKMEEAEREAKKVAAEELPEEKKAVIPEAPLRESPAPPTPPSKPDPPTSATSVPPPHASAAPPPLPSPTRAPSPPPKPAPAPTTPTTIAPTFSLHLNESEEDLASFAFSSSPPRRSTSRARAHEPDGDLGSPAAFHAEQSAASGGAPGLREVLASRNESEVYDEFERFLESRGREGLLRLLTQLSTFKEIVAITTPTPQIFQQDAEALLSRAGESLASSSDTALAEAVRSARERVAIEPRVTVLAPIELELNAKLEREYAAFRTEQQARRSKAAAGNDKGMEEQARRPPAAERRSSQQSLSGLKKFLPGGKGGSGNSSTSSFFAASRLPSNIPPADDADVSTSNPWSDSSSSPTPAPAPYTIREQTSSDSPHQQQWTYHSPPPPLSSEQPTLQFGSASGDIELPLSPEEMAPPPLQQTARASSESKAEQQRKVKVEVTDVSGDAGGDGFVQAKTLELMIAIEEECAAGWMLFRKWSEFEKLDAALQRAFPQAGTKDFPRAFLPSLRFKKSADVCALLGAYLKTLLTDPRYSESDLVLDFLNKEKTSAAKAKLFDLGKTAKPFSQLTQAITDIGGAKKRVSRQATAAAAAASSSPRAGSISSTNLVSSGSAVTAPAPPAPASEPRTSMTTPSASTTAVDKVFEPAAAPPAPVPVESAAAPTEAVSPAPSASGETAAPPSAPASVTGAASPRESTDSLAAQDAVVISRPTSPAPPAVEQPEKVQPAPPNAPKISDEDLNLVLNAIFSILEESYQLAGQQWSIRRGFFRVLERVVRSSYSGVIRSALQSAVMDMTDVDNIASAIRSTRDALWPPPAREWYVGPDENRTDEEKRETYLKARELLIKAKPRGLSASMGDTATRNAVILLHDLFQDPTFCQEISTMFALDLLRVAS